MSAEDRTPAQLTRGLNLPMITLYGLGTIVGGGFYALCGEVVGKAGMLAPLAFLLAALVAMLSAFSFAELSARYPVSGGEAHYTLVAFRSVGVSTLVGWMVIATGIVSAATLAEAFARFAGRFVNLPQWLIIAVLVLTLGLITAKGIKESAWLALVITVIEVGGLTYVFFANCGHLAEIPERWRELTPSWTWKDWGGILAGAFLAFYSFVGFEDMVNVAEEVENPTRNLPVAILLAIGIATVLYVAVALVLVLAVPARDLQLSKSPLAETLADHPRRGDLITMIGMFAGINGALVQIVMASRVVYGLAKQGQAPKRFAAVHSKTHTPLQATALIVGIVLVLAIWLPLDWLAMITSGILLAVYAVVNLSLWKIKLHLPVPATGAPNYPIWLPFLGACICCLFLVAQLWLVLTFSR